MCVCVIKPSAKKKTLTNEAQLLQKLLQLSEDKGTTFAPNFLKLKKSLFWKKIEKKKLIGYGSSIRQSISFDFKESIKIDMDKSTIDVNIALKLLKML